MKAARDQSRTLANADAAIATREGGFALCAEGEHIASIVWLQVAAVFGFTRCRDGHTGLCLSFVQHDDDQVVVEENLPDWNGLVARLPGVFPGMDIRWRERTSAEHEALVPMTGIIPGFTANLVEVWPPDDA